MEIAELDLDRGVGHGAAALVGRQDPVRSNPWTVPGTIDDFSILKNHNPDPGPLGIQRASDTKNMETKKKVFKII